VARGVRWFSSAIVSTTIRVWGNDPKGILMSRDARFEPDSFQTISDLGQLKAFTHPLQARMLRVLQKYEVTPAKLASVVDAPEDVIGQHLTALMQAGLVKQVDEKEGQTIYRAGARYYGFLPDPGDMEMVAGPVSLALLEAVGQELSLSMNVWPSQRMIGQLRRARLSPLRVMEFTDRLEALVNEYWGSPDHPLDEKDGDPVMSLASVVYRYPDED
jgi:DNA-binding transcriptional ArsR family regulator